MGSILIVEDKESMSKMLKQSLEAEGFESTIAPNGARAIDKLKDGDFDLVLTDLNLPEANGIEVLKASKERAPLRPVIVMTAFGSIETAVDAMKEGAFDFITKPFNVDHLVLLINRALENRRIVTENILLKDSLAPNTGMSEIIGQSKAIKDIAEVIRRVAPSKTTVLLQGKSGTGKELFARALHYLSDRKERPFVTINCAAIPKDLLESEFFGHEKGAFTGAESRKLGKFELASGGTIFLDEIGELDKGLQAKMLRVLQEGEIDRVGGTKSVKVDVRVLAASNKDLSEAVKNGEFREDLFYRINVFPITIPPLRERVDDIPLLADFFIKKHTTSASKSPKSLSPESIELLMKQEWKGNVRELENLIERALIMSDSDIIGPSMFNVPAGTDRYLDTREGKSYTLEDVSKNASRIAEEKMIRNALKNTSGNKTKAAALLNVSYKTLLTKIKDYEIS
jgi:DNA-binding NtrC family response regulator